MPRGKPYNRPRWSWETVCESRLDCPHCGRKAARPGGLDWETGEDHPAVPQGVHEDSCPRSRASQVALREEMVALGAPRPFYPAKGVFMVRNARGVTKSGVNPGVPFVQAPKLRTAGGLPRGVLKLPTKRNPKTGAVLEWTLIEAKQAAEIFLEDFGELGRKQTVELGKNALPI